LAVIAAAFSSVLRTFGSAEVTLLRAIAGANPYDIVARHHLRRSHADAGFRGTLRGTLKLEALRPRAHLKTVANISDPL
jgi:hypothetical protein